MKSLILPIVVLVVAHRFYVQRHGTIASRDLFGFHRRKRDSCPGGMIDPQREHDGRQDDRGQEREQGPVHENLSRHLSAHYTSPASPRFIERAGRRYLDSILISLGPRNP